MALQGAYDVAEERLLVAVLTTPSRCVCVRVSVCVCA
jgi:hypothetical protein